MVATRDSISLPVNEPPSGYLPELPAWMKDALRPCFKNTRITTRRLYQQDCPTYLEVNDDTKMIRERSVVYTGKLVLPAWKKNVWFRTTICQEEPQPKRSKKCYDETRQQE